MKKSTSGTDDVFVYLRVHTQCLCTTYIFCIFYSNYIFNYTRIQRRIIYLGLVLNLHDEVDVRHLRPVALHKLQHTPKPVPHARHASPPHLVWRHHLIGGQEGGRRGAGGGLEGLSLSSASQLRPVREWRPPSPIFVLTFKGDHVHIWFAVLVMYCRTDSSIIIVVDI
jgi:hypothetical protein